MAVRRLAPRGRARCVKAVSKAAGIGYPCATLVYEVAPGKAIGGTRGLRGNMGTVVSLREFRERRAGVTDPAGEKAAHRPRERSVEPRDRGARQRTGRSGHVFPRAHPIRGEASPLQTARAPVPATPRRRHASALLSRGIIVQF